MLLVLDSMTGQEAVRVAAELPGARAFDGVVLTKLDGDARGGAALVKAVTGRPIKLVSVGEKLDQLEFFYPDRMASRILGMGDVLSLIERAEAAVEQDEQRTLEAQMRKGQFTFDDFLSAQRMLRRMGPLQGVLKLIPGLGQQLKDVNIDDRELKRVEAIVLSMTPYERASRRDRRQATPASCERQRHDRAAGEPPDGGARKEMEKMMKGMSKGKLPQIPGLTPDGVPGMAPPRSRKKSKSKKSKTRSRR